MTCGVCIKHSHEARRERSKKVCVVVLGEEREGGEMVLVLSAGEKRGSRQSERKGRL